MGLSIGNKIELVLLEQVIKNDKEKRVLVSKIYDLLPDNTLQIAMPIYDGRVIPLEVGSKYSACFYTDKGLMQANVLIMNRYKSGNIFFMEVLLLGELQKVQRREFYRYSCILDARLRGSSEHEFSTGIPDDITIPEDELDWMDVKILDISGGGARICQKKKVEKNGIFKLKFSLFIVDEMVTFNLFARVLASSLMRNRDDVYEQRLEFMQIKREERDKIVKYIFESERVARAKEMGR